MPVFLREFSLQNTTGAGITSIEIQRRDFGSPSITIEIHAARPAVFLGRDTQTLDQLRDALVHQLYTFYRKRNLADPGKIHLSLHVKPIIKSRNLCSSSC